MTYKSSGFKMGDKVRLTIEGYVYGAATNGLSLTATPTDGSGHAGQRLEMVWPFDRADLAPDVEMLQAAYAPQPGDVALWKSDTPRVAPMLVTYCQVSETHKGWYMGGIGTLILLEVDHTSERFQLVARDGKTVPSTPAAASVQSERQTVLDNYTPKQGDVGVFTTASGSPVTVTYRRNDRHPNNTCGWYQANGVESKGAHKDPSFQLVLRDGCLQEGINV